MKPLPWLLLMKLVVQVPGDHTGGVLFRPKVGGGISLMVFLVIHISLLDAVLLPNWKVTKLKIFTS